jgi:hypothetical protein
MNLSRSDSVLWRCCWLCGERQRLSRALKFGHSLQDVFGSAGENELVIDQLELSNRDGNIVLRQAEKAASIDDGI